MRAIILVLFLCSIAAHAGGNLISNNIYGADVILHEKWESSVKHMRFPLLPKPEELKEDNKLPYTERQRYIFHLHVDGLAIKQKFFEDNNWWIVYKVKGFGSYALIVHPEFDQCFAHLKKKFDMMQWVVTYWGKLGDIKVLVLEQPRQCVGNFKDTGGKLEDPIL